jgi:hypothetical protein
MESNDPILGARLMKTYGREWEEYQEQIRQQYRTKNLKEALILWAAGTVTLVFLYALIVLFIIAFQGP